MLSRAQNDKLNEQMAEQGLSLVKRWFNPVNQMDAEKALDAGRLYGATNKGTWWLCRRNGRTKTWKTRPGHWRIPIKAGFRATGELSHHSDMTSFRIAGSREDAEHA